MTGKREEARERAAVRRRELAKERAREVIPWLRALGFRAEEARWRAERCEAIPEASLEDRVRLALSHVGSMGRSARMVLRHFNDPLAFSLCGLAQRW